MSESTKPTNVIRGELVCKPLSFANFAKRKAAAYAFRNDAIELICISVNSSLKASGESLEPITHNFCSDYGSAEIQSVIKRLVDAKCGVEYLDDNTSIKITPPTGRKAVAK